MKQEVDDPFYVSGKQDPLRVAQEVFFTLGSLRPLCIPYAKMGF